MSLKEALARFQGGIELRVDPKDRPKLALIKETCERHKGQNPLFLQTEGDDGLTRRIRAGRDKGITITEELANELCEILGHDRVGIVRV